VTSNPCVEGGIPTAAPALTEENTLITVCGGTLRGVRTSGLTMLRGVRYATAERFTPPVPERPWQGIRDALEHGGISPQPRRDSAVGTSDEGFQSEDCLNLTIVTPAADGKRRPVLVWLHGGSYRNGAGSWDRYRTDRLAREGDVVVVSVNSRLGVLGYLHAPGVSEGNLGLLDQIEALRWIRDNAANLGGNPDNITLVGQSSGAHAIACLLGITQARPLFRRVVLQSPPLGLGLGDATKSGRVAKRFLARLGQDPHDASLEELLTAQQLAGSGLVPAFGPVAGVDPLPDLPEWRGACRAGAESLEVILGSTRRELAYFLAGGSIARRLPVLGHPIENAVIEMVTRLIFARPTLRFGKLLARAGAQVFAYRIDGPATTSPYRAAHCSDLPWLFGDEAGWTAAPVIAGQTWEEVTDHGRPMRSAWLSFAANGAPGLTNRGWTPYGRRGGAVFRF
jgi:para-nitrobenzyl esterase